MTSNAWCQRDWSYPHRDHPGIETDFAVADPVAHVGRWVSEYREGTLARARGKGFLAGVEKGLVAAHVRLADPTMAATTPSGDHVDLTSSDHRCVGTGARNSHPVPGFVGEGRTKGADPERFDALGRVQSDSLH